MPVRYQCVPAVAVEFYIPAGDDSSNRHSSKQPQGKHCNLRHIRCHAGNCSPCVRILDVTSTSSQLLYGTLELPSLAVQQATTN